MNITTGKITGIVLAVVMLVVLFQILPSVIPLGATAVHNLSDSLGGQSATIGTSASTFALQIDDLTGWFWVIGPFVLVISLVVGLFLGKRRR